VCSSDLHVGHLFLQVIAPHSLGEKAVNAEDDD
jgi:hypothetical protein